MTLPIVDWDAMRALEPPTWTRRRWTRSGTTLARSWLETLRAALDAAITIRNPSGFLLGSLDESRANVVLEFVERARKRILMVLDGVAADAESARSACSSSTAKTATINTSRLLLQGWRVCAVRGMFLQHGYGHFVFVGPKFPRWSRPSRTS